MRLLRAVPEDAERLTDLTMRSKAFWGYDSSQMELWRDELSISPDYIQTNPVYKLVDEGGINGFYAFKRMNQNTVQLDSLFIEPRFIGKGYGSLLLEDFLERVQDVEQVRVILEADPNAQGFYLDKGFQITGHKETSIPGRYLPVMELLLGGQKGLVED